MNKINSKRTYQVVKIPLSDNVSFDVEAESLENEYAIMPLFPTVNYNHLPAKLAEGQYYIGQLDDTHSLKCIHSYMNAGWPLKRPDSYHCKDCTVHQKINNGHYIKAHIRYIRERVRLKNDKCKAFLSAYSNLAVFDITGNYIPFEQHKYCM